MSYSESLRVEFAHDRAKEPVRGSEDAAGYDLHSVEYREIPKGGRETISTGIKIAVPPGTYGRVAPRSGLSVRYGLDIGAGVVDRDYRGVLKVVLINNGPNKYIVNIGDRIAQLVLEQIKTPPRHCWTAR